MKLAVFAALLCGCFSSVPPSMADEVAPAHQSECEVKANAYRAEHPKIEPWNMMKAGYLWFGGTIPPSPPMMYEDEVTGIKVHSGSDGRTLTAEDRNGNALWVRDPFVESNLCPYRTAHPYISRIEGPGDNFLAAPDAQANEKILKLLRTGMNHGYKVGELRDTDRFMTLWFNSSQNGVINLRSGDFYFMGQN